jgi:hypothetical protein
MQQNYPQACGDHRLREMALQVANFGGFAYFCLQLFYENVLTHEKINV